MTQDAERQRQVDQALFHVEHFRLGLHDTPTGADDAYTDGESAPAARR